MVVAYSVNDPVHVTSQDGQRLEGVVAYTGPVSFDKKGSGLDWIGVRLTGSSMGCGKNDGSVQGKVYFSCPAACGLFVKPAAVSKRSLTRLEELRLRRELASVDTTANPGGGGSVATTTTSGSSTSTGSSRPSSLRTPTAGSSSRTGITTPRASTPTKTGTGGVGGSARMSKLEELRQRRAALNAAKEGGGGGKTSVSAATAKSSVAAAESKTSAVSSQPASSAGPASETTTGSAASAAASSAQEGAAAPSVALSSEWQEKMERTKTQIQELTDKLKEKETESSELQSKLQSAQEELKSARESMEQERRRHAVLQSAGSSSEADAALRKELDQVQRERDELTDQYHQGMLQVTQLERSLEREKSSLATAMDDLTRARAEATALSKELQATADQNDARGQSDAFHYKERAKLQAEMSALRRKVELHEKEKLDLTSTVEDLALDKEQLQEEKEALEDKVEILKLDAETAQMEVEELRMELEDAQESAAQAATSTTAALDTSTDTAGGDAQDMAAALQVQNARLREALIRLREQSTMEKMDLSRQLRAATADAGKAEQNVQALENLKALKVQLEEQVNDLKDMVEQGAAFEGMVEDLSDRVLMLEEDVVAARATIREMEEAAELTAEMEEVQADELKALVRDLEGRDTIIRNLEEAIRMQRRREEDLKRTVGNYRTAVDTLKLEKQTLLELQRGSADQDADVQAASQRALARAAQLVTDAAAVRKRQAAAAVREVQLTVQVHRSRRVQSLLPAAAVVAPELSAISGEMAVCTILGKASQTLEGIAASFKKTIRPGLTHESTATTSAGSDSSAGALTLSDDERLEVTTMMNQTDFSHAIIRVSAGLLRFLAAGQWPDVLSKESSTELGSILGHATADLDNTLGMVLLSLKEEGALTVEQSNLGALRQTMDSTMQALQADIEREDCPLLAKDWNPPGWKLFQDASHAKFTCMGATAALSTVLHHQERNNSSKSSAPMLALYNKLEQGSSQAVGACNKLAHLDVTNDKLIRECSALVQEWRTSAERMLHCVRHWLLPQEQEEQAAPGDMQSSLETATAMLQVMTKLLAVLRSAQLPQDTAATAAGDGGGKSHALSPEAADAWQGVAQLTRTIRSMDGDGDDVNYLQRARAVERRLADAVDNEPKLEKANTKLQQLEKSLLVRSKEIAMQNARLAELEKLLAKSSASPIARNSGMIGAGSITSELKSSEEFNSLKEENRVLTEAMDVLQRQVDEYENEIRLLKDFKSPNKRGQGIRGTPRRPMATSMSDLSSPASSHNRRPPGGAGAGSANVGGGSGGATGAGGTILEEQGNTSAFEAALFRPALQRALSEAAEWKAKASGTALFNLPPLTMPFVSSSPLAGGIKDGGESKDQEDIVQLNSALANYRLEKASIRLVDLTNREKSPRAQLNEYKARSAAASRRLEAVVLQCRARRAAAAVY